MSNILIPVDFSLPCHNAYRFGLQLAKEHHLGIILFHCATGSIDAKQSLFYAEDGSLVVDYTRRLQDFATPTADGVDYPLTEIPTGVAVTFASTVSFSPATAILQRAIKDDVAMIVMAPRSSKAVLGKWLGSTSTTVSESCNRPVYLIPPEVSYRPFRKIVVANNHLTAEAYPLWQLQELATLHGARVHFVHVEWPKQYGPLRFVPWRLMEKLVDEQPGAKYPFEVVTVDKEDITAGLMEYADETDADLVVIVNNLRNRWRSLLRASLTQDLALRTNRPVLVLHTQDRPEDMTTMTKEAGQAQHSV